MCVMIRTRLVASLRWRRRQSLSVGRCVRSAPVLVSFVFDNVFVIVIVIVVVFIVAIVIKISSGEEPARIL